MSFKVVVTPKASADVDRLEAWLLAINPPAAAKVGPLLDNAIASLEALPNRGRLLSDGVRELVVRFGRAAYLVRYVVWEDTVLITGILHSREQH